MKFLDQNGVLTLWNKIKSNFFPSTGGTITKMILNSGHTVSVSILPTSGGTLIGGKPSFRIEQTIPSSAGTVTCGCDMTFLLGTPMLKVYDSSKSVSITPDQIQMVNGDDYMLLTHDHDGSNEYAKPIQDLESILV